MALCHGSPRESQFPAPNSPRQDIESAGAEGTNTKADIRSLSRVPLWSVRWLSPTLATAASAHAPETHWPTYAPLIWRESRHYGWWTLALRLSGAMRSMQDALLLRPANRLFLHATAVLPGLVQNVNTKAPPAHDAKPNRNPPNLWRPH